MIYIAHRGNTDGPRPELENTERHIITALTDGFDVEIDVWWDNGFYLGHDAPGQPIGEYFLTYLGLWCHAKNLAALERMLENPKIHCFWHENDAHTITSRGFIWTYPERPLTPRSVALMPEWSGLGEAPTGCFGVCTDYPRRYKV